MHKDYFQRNIQLMNELRSEHFKYREYLEKGKYKLKQKFFGKGKKHYDFDINSQEYFHQQINDITFQSSQTQQYFFQMVNNAIRQPLKVNNKKKFQQQTINSNNLLNSNLHAFPQQSQSLLLSPMSISNPSQCRVLLSRHFYQRIYNLKYKKYLLQQRYHNLRVENKHQTILPFVRSRIQLIDKEIISSINRSTRLQHNDYFEESFVHNGKPVPISQTGQPIYKYLDEEQCWYSSIQRDDILVYTRNSQFNRDILAEQYYPLQSQIKAIVIRDGIDVYLQIEKLVQKSSNEKNQKVAKIAEQFNTLIERQLEIISPGNLVQKQNLTNFGYTIFGMLSNSPLTLPLYPAIYPEFFITLTQSASLFFNNIKFTTQQQIIQLLPKLNSFCQILFKYQNKQILQGKKQIKLGLEDDIDLKKQLHTMLEQLWVQKYVNLPFLRYQYKMEIKKVDWPLDSLSYQNQRATQRNSHYQYKMDTSTAQIINLITLSDFMTFRKHMKRRAQKILSRCQTKYFDMEQIIKYNKKSNEQMTLQELSDLFKIKHTQEKQQFLKPTGEMFLNTIMKKHWLVNPAEIQIQETLKFLSIREDRTKIMNILNGLRCYHRNLCMDLRVLTGEEFKFRLDDEFLINSNKQVVQNFERAIKQTATYMTREQNDNNNDGVKEQFYLQKQYYSKQMLYKKDIVKIKSYRRGQENKKPVEQQGEIPHILVHNGSRMKSNIIYGIVLQSDLPSLQKRILQNGSRIINQYERYIKITSRQQIVDRVQLLRIIYQLQLKFLYQKFKLTELYYYIYQNTTNILDAFKLSQTITKLIYQQPQIQLNSISNHNVTFQQLYQNQIESLKLQHDLLIKFVEKLKSQEQNHVEHFHKNYSQLMKVPLTSQLYLYRDLQPKQKTKNKLQRLNSISSKLSSKSSKAVNLKNNLPNNQQIRQQFDQESVGSDSSFDIENYDQYLLKKDMDAIFDDMIQVDDNKDTTPINTAVQQNIVINPRFQGGPHPYNYACDQLQITTENKQNLMNFFQTLSFAGNVRYLIQSLKQQFNSVYGYVSSTYQSFLSQVMCKFMNDIILNPLKKMKRWRQFESSDPYHEIVTQCCKHYLELMAPAIDPPSNIQMAIASTLQKHQQKLPTFNILSSLDYYSIESLVCLKKPINIASYRQLALGINYLTFLNLRQSLYMIQLRRERLIEAYQKLAVNCGAATQRYSSMYTRSGQSNVFMSVQQLRQFKEQSYQFPVLPQVLTQLKSFLQCENADLQLFQTIIKTTKIKLEDFIIMKNQVNRNFMNSRFDNSRLLAKDSKTVKMIKNRLSGEINLIYNQEMKKNSFVKIKQDLKIKVQRLIKNVQQSDLLSRLTLPKEKISEYCKQLLQQKYKRKLVFEIIDCYWKDLIQTNIKNKVFLESDCLIKRVRKLVECAPYMRRVLHLNQGGERVDKKILYDQKKSVNSGFQILRNTVYEGVFFHPNYVYSRQKLCDEWSQQESFVRMNNLNEFEIHSIPFHPPADKQKLFKWLYKIPHYSLSQYQQKAVNHFIRQLSLPYTGKCSMSEYLESPSTFQPPRNRFFTIYEHYSTLLQYLEINYLLVLLQAEDDTFQSLTYLLKNDHVNFQQLYQLKDDISINESLASMEKQYLKTCFNYKQNRQSDKNTIKQKLQSRGNTKTKQRWVVYDQIIDFIVSKIQGRGLIRQNFLPFIKELQTVLSYKDGIAIDLMKKKTQHISHIFVLSTFQAYLNEQHQKIEQNQSFSHYLFPILKWFLNNQHESYHIVSKSANPRFGLSNKIASNYIQIQKFILGIFNENNSRMVKNSSIIEKYKAVMMINSVNLDQFVRNFLKSKLQSNSSKGHQMGKSLIQRNNSTNNQTTALNSLYLYDMNFLPSGVELFSLIGQQNRLKIFSRMRYFYQKVSDYMKIKPNITKIQQIQDTKLNYVKFLFSSKIQSLSAVVFSAKPNFPTRSKSFKQVSTTFKQQIQKATFMIFDKFQEYKSENKIQFGKSQQKLMAIVQDVKKNQKLAVIYNKLIRQVINVKLTKEQFKSRVLTESIKLLKNEKIQEIESKKIINTSLIPRVHLIASYSSPLILQRKTFISQQYKLAFAQAFINRFRNKVSRVDLLSSGYGFVITVPDLEDCVNFMNKLLFTFAEKEFRYRQQTSQQYFQILLQAVNEKNKVISQQQEIIKYLKSKVQNIMEAEYLGKVTGLLHEKTVIEDKLREVQQSTKGLQDRVRKAVQIQYEKKITFLEAQNQILRNRFNEFKQLFVTLTKDSAKNNFLNVANTIRQKIGDLLNKRIDVKEAFITGQTSDDSKKSSRIVKEQSNNQLKFQNLQKQQVSTQPYTTNDLQRCALGEDIIHDPYYTTKLIQKMRLFNIFKLGSKKIHFQQAEQKKTTQLKQLHQIQDTVIVQSQRQILVRQELKRTQQQLSKKTSQLEKIKQSYEMLDNQRTKLKILIAGKDKKIQQKEREALQNIKKLQQIQKLPSLSQSESKIDKTEQQKPVTKLSQYRKLHNKKSTKIQKSPFVTSIPYEPSVSIYDRFELSNKDTTWRQKCEQLYIQNKKLLTQLQKAHSALTTPTRQGYSLNLRQRKNSESFSHGNDHSLGKKEDSQQSQKEKRFPNLGFKYNLMKQTMNGFGQ